MKIFNSSRFFQVCKPLIMAPVFFVMIMANLTTQVNAQKANLAWNVVCSDAQKPQTCLMRQIHVPAKRADGQPGAAGTVLTLTIQYGAKKGESNRQPYLLAQLPLGVDLRRGMVMQIDKQKEITGNYLRCLKSGCEVNFLVKRELLAKLKSGKTLRVGFVPLGAQEIMVVTASLDGFTKAFKMLK